MVDRIQAPAPENGTLSTWAADPLRHARRLCLLFLQKLFNNAPRGSFHWEEDEEQTELLISQDIPVDFEVVRKRPVITLTRSSVAWGGIGMDQLYTQNGRTGAREHVDLLTGNFVLNCMAGVLTEAESLAFHSANHIWLLRRVLMKLGFHDIGQRCQIQPPSPPGTLVQGAANDKVVVVAVVVPFQFHWKARVLEEDVPLLSSIELSMAIEVGDSYRPTNIKAEGGFGTALTQVDGNPVQFQNMKGNIRPPSIRGRPARVTQTLGSNRPENLTVNVKIGE